VQLTGPLTETNKMLSRTNQGTVTGLGTTVPTHKDRNLNKSYGFVTWHVRTRRVWKQSVTHAEKKRRWWMCVSRVLKTLPFDNCKMQMYNKNSGHACDTAGHCSAPTLPTSLRSTLILLHNLCPWRSDITLIYITAEMELYQFYKTAHSIITWYTKFGGLQT
jgi:hypothetical protein